MNGFSKDDRLSKKTPRARTGTRIICLLWQVMSTQLGADAKGSRSSGVVVKVREVCVPYRTVDI